MSKGKTAAQVAHAAVSCALLAEKRSPQGFREWNSVGQKVAVLKVGSEGELFEFKAVADRQGLPNCVVTDAGRTEIEPGSITCLGIGPEKQSVLDRVTGDLHML